MGGQTSLRVLAPVQGQIQLTVNQAMTTRGDVGEKDADLTILDLPSGATILQPHASRLGTALGKAAFINDQDRRLLAELLQHVAAHLIAHAIGIPDGAGEQALHPVGTSFSSVFSQLPAVFAFGLTQNALQVQERPAARFWTSKAWGNACMQTKERLNPAADIGRGRGL